MKWFSVCLIVISIFVFANGMFLPDNLQNTVDSANPEDRKELRLLTVLHSHAKKHNKEVVRRRTKRGLLNNHNACPQNMKLLPPPVTKCVTEEEYNTYMNEDDYDYQEVTY